MINQIETGSRVISSQGEIKSPLGQRQRLEGFLPNLTKQDAHFVNTFLEFPESPDALFEQMADLLEMRGEKGLKKQDERLSAEEVSVMDVLEPFSGKEKIIIARNLREIQMTDGCTGGCAWCGAEANRHIQKKFSFDSYKEYMSKYGKYFPKNAHFNLYGASDPFDWINSEGRLSYTELARVFGKYSRNRRLYTSTSLPEGSELSFIKFALSYWVDLQDKKTTEKIKKTNYRSGIRISQKKASEGRIRATLQLMKDIDIGSKFVDLIQIVDKEDETKKARYKNVGRSINHPGREESGRDLFGIYDVDSLWIEPSGIYGGAVEAVTFANSKGNLVNQLEPGLVKIPVFVDHKKYGDPRYSDGFSLLPKIRYRIYEKGEFARIETVESARRDILAFDSVMSTFELISGWFLSAEGRKFYKENPKFIPHFPSCLRESLIPQYIDRKATCLSNLANETDDQAVRIVKTLILEADDWIEHMNERLGLDKNGNLV